MPVVGQDGSLMRREGEGERGGGGGNERTVGLRFVSQMTIWSY